MWPHISKFSELVSVALIAGAAVVAHAAEPAAESSALLKQLTPDHLVGLNSLVSATGGRPAPAELLGYNVEADGQRVLETPLIYREGGKLQFDLFWVPREIPRKELTVSVRISGSGPLIEQQFPVEAAGWQTGVVSRQRVDFKHARGWYSGKGLLTVALRAGESEYVMTASPVSIETSNASSKIDAARLSAEFGDKLVRLNTAFRIGNGASTVVVPKTGAGGLFTGVVVVSSTGYDGAPVAGEPVCSVKAGSDLDTLMVMGRHTAPSEPDRYAQIGGERNLVRVFSPEGAPLDFVTVLEFDRPCRPGEITFKYIKEKGALTVKEVALLKADEQK